MTKVMEKSKRNKTNRTRLEIQVDKCYYNNGQYGSYFRVLCRDRQGTEYTFSTPFSFMSCLPTEWVEIEAQVNGAMLHKVYRVVSVAQAKKMVFRMDRAKKWGYVVDFKKADSDEWISDIRQPVAVVEDDVMMETLTPDQELAWADYYDMNDFSHPNETR